MNASTPATPKGHRLRTIGIAAVLVLLVAAVIIVVSLKAGSTSSDLSDVKGKTVTTALLKGIPQNGGTLGYVDAPVRIHVFADLRCPACRQFDTDELPTVIDELVRTHKAQLLYEPLPLLGPDSVTAASSMLAAAGQNRSWQFVQLFYANQGDESGDYVNTKFLDSIASAAGLDMDVYHRDLKDGKANFQSALEAAGKFAKRHDLNGTPSFHIVSDTDERFVGKNMTAAEIKTAVTAVTP